MPNSKSGRQWQRQMSIEDAGVLEQRVFHIEKAVADQATQTANAINQLAQNVSSQIAQVQQNTSEQISALSTTIGNLGTKLEERAKIPWPALAVMLSFLVVVGGLVWFPIAENMKDMKVALITLDKESSSTFLSRAEYTARTDSLGRLRDLQTQLFTDRVGRLENEVKENARSIVPRGEHDEKWSAQRDRDAELTRQIEEMRKNFAEMYSPRDALRTMQERISDLERRLMERRER